MNLKQMYFTQNNCYKANKRHVVKGLMWHSTGANNPQLKRYVGPDDGLLGVNTNKNYWNNPLAEGVEKCCHGFIGKLKDDTVATYQTLPWDMVCWNSGTGKLGYTLNANNTGYIQIEICEDALADPVYFNMVYTEAVEVSALLSKQFGFGTESIICHSEGYTKGIASNHADVMHWFSKHGKSMDTLRADVAKLLSNGSTSGKYGVVKQVIALGDKDKAQSYADDLNKKGEKDAYYKVIDIK